MICYLGFSLKYFRKKRVGEAKYRPLTTVEANLGIGDGYVGIYGALLFLDI